MSRPQTPTEVVTAFMALWAEDGGFFRALEQYLTPDCVYENVGMTRTTGAAESIALFQGMEASLPFRSIGVDLLGLAANGNTVMTERVDHLRGADGQVLISIRLMGVFVVAGGKVSQWRDYFDVTPFR